MAIVYTNGTFMYLANESEKTLWPCEFVVFHYNYVSHMCLMHNYYFTCFKLSL